MVSYNLFLKMPFKALWLWTVFFTTDRFYFLSACATYFHFHFKHCSKIYLETENLNHWINVLFHGLDFSNKKKICMKDHLVELMYNVTVKIIICFCESITRTNKQKNGGKGGLCKTAITYMSLTDFLISWPRMFGLKKI